jgi:hypothetical protein
MNAIHNDAFRTAPDWKTSHWYHIGDRVKFFGMLLRCGVDHYAGSDSNHPWDPGWGWGNGAAFIWTVLTPDGMSSEADATRKIAESLRGVDKEDNART